MLNQIQTQKQTIKILPQQIQLLNIFHLTTTQLDQRIQDELYDNPLLEEAIEDNETEAASKEPVEDYKDWDEFVNDDIPDYKLEYQNYFSEEQTPFRTISNAADYREELKVQVNFKISNNEEKIIAEYLVDSLNEFGLLEHTLDVIADDFSFKYNKLVEVEAFEKVLAIIHDCEPAGVGARSTQECFLLQLKAENQKDPIVKKATQLIEKHYEDLSGRNMNVIMSALDIDEEELSILIRHIGSLKLKPVAEVSDSYSSNRNIIPDFIVSEENDKITVSLFSQRSSALHISQNWMEVVNDKTKEPNTDKQTMQYLKSKLNAATWFINAIKERETNMLNIMNAIVHLQYDYFKNGGDERLLQPMILKNVADIAGVDISTVSRITCNKYADTSFGMILLKRLFTEGLTNDNGETVSNKVIQVNLKELIEAEDKSNPLTDKELVSLLEKRGFKIARRTVAKYREQMRIPVSQMRRTWELKKIKA